MYFFLKCQLIEVNQNLNLVNGQMKISAIKTIYSLLKTKLSKNLLIQKN